MYTWTRCLSPILHISQEVSSERDRRNYYCRQKLTAAKKCELIHQQTFELGHFKLFILCSVSNEELQNIYQASYINVLFVIMML